MAGNVILEDQGLVIRFPFRRDLVELVKSLPTRRWNPNEKYWLVPAADASHVVETLRPFGFSFDEATLRAAEDSVTPSMDHEVSAPPGLKPGDLTVGALNTRAAMAVRQAFPSDAWLVGEIADFDKSRHKRIVHFRLVDREADGRTAAVVSAVLFPDARERLERTLERAGTPFRFEDEVRVRLRVRVDLYEAWGAYRVLVQELDVQFTLGETARRREEIVRVLTSEGLVGRNPSLPMPPTPLRIGLITSLQSDAYRDVIQTLEESGFAFDVRAHDARVQGHRTETTVLAALGALAADPPDVVLICRGGGSRTDLAWFDTLTLGRAVALFPVPIIVGIGHEQDRGVLDAIARSQKTPTAAASLLVRQVRSHLEHVEALGARVMDHARRHLDRVRQSNTEQTVRLSRVSQWRIEVCRNHLRNHTQRLSSAARERLSIERSRLTHATHQLPRVTAVLLTRQETGL
ncbi:MAG: exodeoxyribonuclease VII large subunit, partial [Myxococcota bacterium]|nr:exodeoxyribonuclease VII large subunit [Myxococcota bacterium]